MRAWLLVLVNAIGCAQLLGIDETTSGDGASDAGGDARRDGPTADARACTEGDARITDPMTGACYALFTTPRTRDEARTTCNAIGGGTMLASVQSGNENQLLTTLIGQTSAFLGGNDELTEGAFKWDDGTDVVLTNWNTGEPNNGLGMYEEDCIVIHGTFGGKWDDRPCAPGAAIDGTYAFICERH
jgi:hypothetical protein